MDLLRGSALDAGSDPFDEAFDLFEGGHGGIAGSGHGKRPVCGPEFDGFVGVVEGDEPVDESGGEAVATADAIKDLEVGPMCGLVEGAIGVADGSPVIAGCRADGAEGGGDDLEVRELLDGFFDHLFEGADVDVGDIFVDTFDFETEAGGEIFFVTDHDINEGGDAAIDFLGAFMAAYGLPERGAVVEVVGHDDAVGFGGLDGFDDEFGGGIGERGEDTAGVEPADALFAEDGVPIEIAGFELGGGGITAIGDADGTPDAEAAFGEIEAVTDGATDAVVGAPLDEGGIDTALEDKVFDEAADFVFGEGGRDGGAEAEATAEASGDIVFAATLPGLELAGGSDATFTGIEAEHDFAEGDHVEFAVLRGFDVENGHDVGAWVRLETLNSAGDFGKRGGKFNDKLNNNLATGSKGMRQIHYEPSTQKDFTMKKMIVLAAAAALVMAPAVVAGEKPAAAAGQCSGAKSACCAAKKDTKTVKHNPLVKGATLLATR